MFWFFIFIRMTGTSRQHQSAGKKQSAILIDHGQQASHDWSYIRNATDAAKNGNASCSTVDNNTKSAHHSFWSRIICVILEAHRTRQPPTPNYPPSTIFTNRITNTNVTSNRRYETVRKEKYVEKMRNCSINKIHHHNSPTDRKMAKQAAAAPVRRNRNAGEFIRKNQTNKVFCVNRVCRLSQPSDALWWFVWFFKIFIVGIVLFVVNIVRQQVMNYQIICIFNIHKELISMRRVVLCFCVMQKLVDNVWFGLVIRSTNCLYIIETKTQRHPTCRGRWSVYI